MDNKYYIIPLFLGHIFKITNIEKDPFGNRVTLSCSPHCCDYPLHIELTIPEKILHIVAHEYEDFKSKALRL